MTGAFGTGDKAHEAADSLASPLDTSRTPSDMPTPCRDALCSSPPTNGLGRRRGARRTNVHGSSAGTYFVPGSGSPVRGWLTAPTPVAARPVSLLSSAATLHVSPATRHPPRRHRHHRKGTGTTTKRHGHLHEATQALSGSLERAGRDCDCDCTSLLPLLPLLPPYHGRGLELSTTKHRRADVTISCASGLVEPSPNDSRSRRPSAPRVPTDIAARPLQPTAWP